jgi:hypothetical protein
MVPLSGIDEPENLQEKVLKLAYERIRKFGHYKSLWAYKEKFDHEWQMMYPAYDAPIDQILSVSLYPRPEMVHTKMQFHCKIALICVISVFYLFLFFSRKNYVNLNYKYKIA